MENNTFMMPIGGKMVLRSTGEEVEIIDFNLPNRGMRTNPKDLTFEEGDWVTYIDSKGDEHIKEHLNIQLDFKPCTPVQDMFDKLINNDWGKSTPSTENQRAYEVAKDYLIKFNCSVGSAVSIGKQLAHELKED